MQSHGGINALKPLGNVQRLPRRLQIRGDTDDLRHLGRLSALDDLRQFFGKVGITEVCVAIDKHDA